MGLNRDFIGRTFPRTEPYEVSRVKIREFADAVGDPNPVYRDAEAAKAAGHPDVIAPPTFPAVFALADSGLGDPELGLDYAMVVHVEERFSYSRPLRAGDIVVCEATITNIKTVGTNEVVSLSTEISTIEGEHVCTAFNSIAERGS